MTTKTEATLPTGGGARGHFLDEEVRCGFTVTRERKKVWKVLLDIFQVFIAVCEKHDLKWFVSDGTLLGASRHGGFIPWDDDIDVIMPRADYERLQQILPGELPPHLFMQTTLTDPEYPIFHLKIRDSRTTAIERAHTRLGLRYCMGMFFDVFPMDAAPDDPAMRRKVEKKIRLLHSFHAVAFRRRFESFKQRITTILARILLAVVGRRRLYEIRENAMRRIPGAEGGKYAYYGGGQLRFRKENLLERSWFDSCVTLPFEYLQVRAPAGFEAMNENQYGKDWRTPIQAGAGHCIVDMDPDTPYTETLAREGYYA